jgi:hypothetical protein
MRDLDIGSMVVNVNGYASAMGHRQHPAPARTNQRSLHKKILELLALKWLWDRRKRRR